MLRERLRLAEHDLTASRTWLTNRLQLEDEREWDSRRIRLVRIGTGESPVDLQPCGGTHVRATGEIGRALIGKIEKKGKRNRRVSLTLAD